MKIIVRESKRNIHLRFPTGFVLNGCTAFALCREAKKHGVTLTYPQMRTLIKALRQYRKTHPDWALVEVRGAKGEYVQIKL